MDSIENKIKAYYRQRRMEDESTVPEFDAFLNQRKPKIIHPRITTFRIAASVAAVAAFAAWYFFSSKKTDATQITFRQSFPTEELGRQVDQGFVWKWKSPTDHLLNDSFELVNKTN